MPTRISNIRERWRVPTVTAWLQGFLEGQPSAEQLARKTKELDAERSNWEPDAEAWALVERIRVEAVGRVVVLQGWDPIMLMLEGEGPYPVRAVCRGVLVEQNGAGHRQAFMLLEAPEAVVIPDGYDGFGRYYTGPHDDGLYRFNLAGLYEIRVKE